MHQQQSHQTRYALRSRRGSHHLLEGLTVAGTRRLQNCTRSELLELREKSYRMLRHRTVVNTLPDKGAKLKESINQIDALLNTDSVVDDTITPDNTHPDRESALTAMLARMSVNSAAYEARRKSIASANARARSVSTGELPYPSSRRPSSASASTGTLRGPHSQPKVQMMSLDESVQLQQQHQAIIKENDVSEQQKLPPNGSVADEDALSWNLRRMGLNSTCQSTASVGSTSSSTSSRSSVKGHPVPLSEDDGQSSNDEENDYNQVYNNDEEDDEA